MEQCMTHIHNIQRHGTMYDRDIINKQGTVHDRDIINKQGTVHNRNITCIAHKTMYNT